MEDGTTFEGKSFGVSQDAVGQVVLNTAVVGYQEMLTDPANSGKILCLTYPLIGNYGVNEKFNESKQTWVNGLVIKEDSRMYSNWQAKESLGEFLQKQKVVAISGVDTRTLAVKIRNDGEMYGIISSNGLNAKELLKKLVEFKNKKKESILEKISVKEITKFKGKKQRIVVIDLGILKSILKQLSDLGLKVILVPYDTDAKEILKLKPNGIIIPNGPEDDAGLIKVIATTKQILCKIPLLGISTGHQVIAQATGAKINKMKTGHHGVNYPVKSPSSAKGEITVQNHSFIVDEGSLNHKDIQIIERNLNDKSIEKLRSKKLKFISIQYYPSSPGLGQINPVFGEFMEMIRKKPVTRNQ